MTPLILGHVHAVLAGHAVPFTRPGSFSAIAKQPVSGRAMAGPLGLDGDEQADRRVHGGPDKALHLYAFEHYAAWRRDLDGLGGLDLLAAPGAFGENLSTRGITEDSLCLGDRLQIGDALLEVSQGRQPCWKLNDRFGVPDMALRLQQTLRTGWYCRVCVAGRIGADDAIALIDRPYPAWPVSRLMGVLYQRCLDPLILTALLDLPLVPTWQKIIERRLASGQIEDWSQRLSGPQ